MNSDREAGEGHGGATEQLLRTLSTSTTQEKIGRLARRLQNPPSRPKKTLVTETEKRDFRTE
jgi:16S rRNA A1518/A1519 N6-dimethyltransferase RsmA/KsgA/DIM1 with predicted DNA glycosylase/AP lyase activity